MQPHRREEAKSGCVIGLRVRGDEGTGGPCLGSPAPRAEAAHRQCVPKLHEIRHGIVARCSVHTDRLRRSGCGAGSWLHRTVRFRRNGRSSAAAVLPKEAPIPRPSAAAHCCCGTYTHRTSRRHSLERIPRLFCVCLRPCLAVCRLEAEQALTCAVTGPTRCAQYCAVQAVRLGAVGNRHLSARQARPRRCRCFGPGTRKPAGWPCPPARPRPPAPRDNGPPSHQLQHNSSTPASKGPAMIAEPWRTLSHSACLMACGCHTSIRQGNRMVSAGFRNAGAPVSAGRTSRMLQMTFAPWTGLD